MELFGIDAVVSLGATASAQNRYSKQISRAQLNTSITSIYCMVDSRLLVYAPGCSIQKHCHSQYHNHDWHNDMVHRLVWHIASAYSITLYKRLNSQIDIPAIINHITR